MNDIRTTSKKRLPVPQVLIIENGRGDVQWLEREYGSVLEGVKVTCVEYFGHAQDFVSAVHVDFVVILINFGTDAKAARRQISTISIACPEAAIILMARDGFDAHDARVKAVVPRYPLTPLATEILKRIPAKAVAAD